MRRIEKDNLTDIRLGQKFNVVREELKMRETTPDRGFGIDSRLSKLTRI